LSDFLTIEQAAAELNVAKRTITRTDPYYAWCEHAAFKYVVALTDLLQLQQQTLAVTRLAEGLVLMVTLSPSLKKPAFTRV
jgi:hypothetical protein